MDNAFPEPLYVTPEWMIWGKALSMLVKVGILASLLKPKESQCLPAHRARPLPMRTPAAKKHMWVGHVGMRVTRHTYRSVPLLQRHMFIPHGHSRKQACHQTVVPNTCSCSSPGILVLE
jgi:hypothetical protein